MKPLFSFKLSHLSLFSVRLQKVGVIALVYSLFLLPLALLACYINSEWGRLKDAEENLEQLAIRMEQCRVAQKGERVFREKYSQVNSRYVAQFLESIIPLQREINILQAAHSHPAFHSCRSIKNRLEELTGGRNQWTFSDESKKMVSGIEEVILAQKNPVELDRADLQLFVALVEGVPVGDHLPARGRPQLIIQKFHLRKKNLAERETYSLETNLIKRGYIQ